MYKPPSAALNALEKYRELRAATTPDEPLLGALIDTYEKQIEFAFTSETYNILVRTGEGNPDLEMAVGVSQPELETIFDDNHPEGRTVHCVNLAFSPDEIAIYHSHVAPSVTIELPVDSKTGEPDMLAVFAYLHSWITNTRIPSTLYQEFTIRELNAA